MTGQSQPGKLGGRSQDLEIGGAEGPRLPAFHDEDAKDLVAGQDGDIDFGAAGETGNVFRLAGDIRGISQLAVAERTGAQALSGRDSHVGGDIVPAGRGREDSITTLPIEQEDAEEVVAEGILAESVDHRAANLLFAVSRSDRRAQSEQGGLAPAGRSVLTARNLPLGPGCG